MQKKIVLSALLLKGFSSVIIQTLLVRELLIVFFGNELTFSIILSVWLIGGALGSGYIANLFKKRYAFVESFCHFQLLLSLWAPLCLLIIRSSKSLLCVPFGETFQIGHICIITILSMLAPAIADGAIFNIGFHLVKEVSPLTRSSMAKVYLLESLGVILGGIAFTFVLLSFLHAFQIVFLVSSVNLLFAFLLLKTTKIRWLQGVYLTLFIIALGFFASATHWQKVTLKNQWQGKNLILYENSVYGNIAVIKEKDQSTLFYDGLPILSVPSPCGAFAQDFIHIPMLSRDDVKTVLFIGRAAAGPLKESLKYPLEKIIYLEIDPVFIKVLRALKDPGIQKELDDPRMTIKKMDARTYIKNPRDSFDLIFVNAGLPTSLALNRYATAEFFHETKKALSEKGLLVVKTWGTLSYLSDPFSELNASFYNTLKSVFRRLHVIPGDGYNIFLASNTDIKLDPAGMMRNYSQLGIKTDLINASYLRLRLDDAYGRWFHESLKEKLNTFKINRDLKPAGLYAGLNLYYSQFSKRLPGVFQTFKKIKPFPLMLLIVLVSIIINRVWRAKKPAAWALNLSVTSSGFSAMSNQMIVLFLFQSLCGHLFQWLAILTASFMTGISLGTVYADKKLKTLTSFKKLRQIETILPLTTLFLTLTTISLSGHGTVLSKSLFSLICISNGALIGLELPIIYELYPKKNETTPSYTAGLLYCLDLSGACLAAFLTPLILIPSCGIIALSLLLCSIKLANAGNLYVFEKRRN